MMQGVTIIVIDVQPSNHALQPPQHFVATHRTIDTLILKVLGG